jgi:hypothetical protein
MRSLLPLLAVALALAGAGCGGGSLNGASSAPTTAAPPPASTTAAPARTTPAPPRTGSTTATAPQTTPAPRTAPVPSTTVPNTAFVAQANGVCSREDRALTAKLKRSPQAATGGDVRAAVQLLIASEQKRIAGLRALTPPASIRARYVRFTAALQTRLGMLQRAVTSGSGKALPRAGALALQQSTQRVMQLGASLGLNCAG